MARYLPPVHSPLSLQALLAGFSAARSEGASAAARARVERWLRQRFAPRGMLLTDSGTSALCLALTLAVLRRPTRRIALPAWGCYDLATACDGADVDVLLYDLDPDRLTPDLESLQRALGAGAEAVVVVHYFGLPVPFAEVRALTDQHGATIIEDAAQGVGGTLAGQPCGALGDLAVLSFGRGKGVTGGRGGALLAHTAAWAELVASELSAVTAPVPGWGDLPKAAAQGLLARPGLYAIPAALPFLRLGETIYHAPSAPAHTPRSALGILSLTTGLEAAETAKRRANAERLRAAVAESPRLHNLPVTPHGVGGYLRLPVAARDASAGFMTPEARRLGIMPGYPGPLAVLPGFQRRIRNPGLWPGADQLVTRLGTCPTHGLLSQGDLERLERWLRSAA